MTHHTTIYIKCLKIILLKFLPHLPSTSELISMSWRLQYMALAKQNKKNPRNCKCPVTSYSLYHLSTQSFLHFKSWKVWPLFLKGDDLRLLTNLVISLPPCWWLNCCFSWCCWWRLRWVTVTLKLACQLQRQVFWWVEGFICNKCSDFNVGENIHGSSDICLMGLIYSIEICEIFHQTFGPSHLKWQMFLSYIPSSARQWYISAKYFSVWLYQIAE